MWKLIFNAAAEPVAPVWATKHTMYVDCDDGKLKMKDCDWCVNSVSCSDDISETLLPLCWYSDIDCVVSSDEMWNGWEYNFNKLIINEGVTLRFYWWWNVIIWAKTFCNLWTIDAYDPTIWRTYKTKISWYAPMLCSMINEINNDWALSINMRCWWAWWWW